MSTHYRTPQKIVKTISATGTPEKITTTSTPATRAIVCGFKSASPRTTNTTSVWLGTESTDGSQIIEVGTSGNYVLEQIDLSEWYVDVETAGDGVVVVYW